MGFDERMKKRKNKAWEKSEKGVVSKLDGIRNVGSGALPSLKGDGRLPRAVLLEAKSTTGESIGVKLSWLQKIGDEARAVNRTPALSLDFTDDLGKSKETWIAVPLWMYQELVSESG